MTSRRLAVTAVVVLTVLLTWRPLAAWWCEDQGSLAYVHGDMRKAADWFATGLSFEPRWRVLLEDDGRAMLDADPVTALARFREADCGQACLAEAGDAESRMGRAREAVDDYLAAHAVERVIAAVDRLSSAGRFDDAIALERALQARLGSGMLAQADLALAYYKIGTLDAAAAANGASRDARRRTGYERDAIRSYRHASDLAPFNEGYLLALAFAELQWGDRASAREAFDRELDLHPHQADAERGLVQLDAAAGKR